MVLTPTLSQDEASSLIDRVKGTIVESGGDIAHEELWGMRRLAYPIYKVGNKFLEGNYFFTRFNMDSQHARDVEGLLRLSENVLRFLMVKAEGPLPVQIQEEVTVAEAEEAEPAATVEEEVAVAEAGAEPEAVAAIEEEVAVEEAEEAEPAAVVEEEVAVAENEEAPSSSSASEERRE